jgi:hypothetical protein
MRMIYYYSHETISTGTINFPTFLHVGRTSLLRLFNMVALQLVKSIKSKRP